jgi:hypothetical protein
MRFPVLACLAAAPLAAQSWGLRVEVPFPKGQNLPQTLLTGTGQLASGSLDTGKGLLATLDRRLIVFGPILRLEATFEGAWLRSEGDVAIGTLRGRGTLTSAGRLACSSGCSATGTRRRGLQRNTPWAGPGCGSAPAGACPCPSGPTSPRATSSR